MQPCLPTMETGDRDITYMWPRVIVYSNLSRDMLNHELPNLSPVSIDIFFAQENIENWISKIAYFTTQSEIFSMYCQVQPDKTSPNLIFCFIKISHRIRDLHLMTLSRATRFLTSNCREEAWNRSHVCLRLNAPAVSWPPSAATGTPVSATPVARLVAALGLAGHKTCPLRFLLDFLTRSFVIEYS